MEVTTATAGTLEVVVSFSGPSLTLRLSDVCLHVQLVAEAGSPSEKQTNEQVPATPTGTVYTHCVSMHGLSLNVSLDVGGSAIYRALCPVLQVATLQTRQQLHPGYGIN